MLESQDLLGGEHQKYMIKAQVPNAMFTLTTMNQRRYFCQRTTVRRRSVTAKEVLLIEREIVANSSPTRSSFNAVMNCEGETAAICPPRPYLAEAVIKAAYIVLHIY